ncbi:hypothetical protein T484DRAFT_1921881, partial [Baffinella frigidus]
MLGRAALLRLSGISPPAVLPRFVRAARSATSADAPKQHRWANAAAPRPASRCLAGHVSTVGGGSGARGMAASSGLAALRVVDLKERLKHLGLKVSGSKAELVERLQAEKEGGEGVVDARVEEEGKGGEVVVEVVEREAEEGWRVDATESAGVFVEARVGKVEREREALEASEERERAWREAKEMEAKGGVE